MPPEYATITDPISRNRLRSSNSFSLISALKAGKVEALFIMTSVSKAGMDNSLIRLKDRITAHTTGDAINFLRAHNDHIAVVIESESDKT